MDLTLEDTMDKKTLIQLYAKRHSGQLNGPEREQFYQALHDPMSEGLLDDVVEDDWFAITADELYDVSTERAEAIFRAIVHKPKILWPRFAAAASILLMLGTGAYFLHQRLTISDQQTISTARIDIPPGRHQAILTLANGQQIILKQGLTGKLAQQGQTTVRISGNHNIQYVNSATENTVSYNMMSTKNGEQSPYPLVLADGTKVWLNAASSITFPTAFPGKTRVVKIKGEAYFQVKHNSKQPFQVEAGGGVNNQKLC